MALPARLGAHSAICLLVFTSSVQAFGGARLPASSSFVLVVVLVLLSQRLFSAFLYSPLVFTSLALVQSMVGNATAKDSPVTVIDMTENDNVVVAKPEETRKMDLSGGSPAPLPAQNLKEITLEVIHSLPDVCIYELIRDVLQRLKKVPVYSNELSELQQPLSSCEKVPDSLETLLDASTAESSEVPEKILSWLAMFVEGRHEPLSSLQSLLHEKLQQRWSSLALRSAVLRVAQRKSFGSKPAKSIDLNENDAVRKPH